LGNSSSVHGSQLSSKPKGEDRTQSHQDPQPIFSSLLSGKREAKHSKNDPAHLSGSQSLNNAHHSDRESLTVEELNRKNSSSRTEDHAAPDHHEYGDEEEDEEGQGEFEKLLDGEEEEEAGMRGSGDTMVTMGSS
jgi:hypothetical protein